MYKTDSILKRIKQTVISKQIENGLKTNSKWCLVKCISKQTRFKTNENDQPNAQCPWLCKCWDTNKGKGDTEIWIWDLGFQVSN